MILLITNYDRNKAFCSSFLFPSHQPRSSASRGSRPLAASTVRLVSRVRPWLPLVPADDGTHCLLSESMHSFPGGSLLACSTQDTQDRCPEQLHLPWHRSSASSPLAKALDSLHLIQESIARLWALDAVHGLILSFSVDWAIWDQVTISSP